MYIVIETFWLDNISLVTDENGKVKIFHGIEVAKEEAARMQRGIVVRI